MPLDPLAKRLLAMIATPDCLPLLVICELRLAPNFTPRTLARSLPLTFRAGICSPANLARLPSFTNVSSSRKRTSFELTASGRWAG